MDQRPRLIVMTDISTLSAGSGEPDDTQSLVRLLLYSNDLRIEGLIATHTGHDEAVHPEFIASVICEYGKVRNNLALHDPRYPTAEALLGLVKAGSPERHRIGRGMDSEGSDWIISVADTPDPRPVWIAVWGGSRELAQALWKVRQTRGHAGLARFVDRLRVYAIGDQDRTGPEIRRSYRDLFYIRSRLANRGLYRGGDQSLVTRDWVSSNITTGHGPLGAAYPNYDGGDPWGLVKGVKEGDTTSVLYLVPNGLADPAHPTWGGWGGRFVGGGSRYHDAADRFDGDTSPQATAYRWRAAFQADFAARMDWCVKPYSEANHAPVAAVDGEAHRTVRPHQTVTLAAAGSADPDGDSLSYDWSVYLDPGSYRGRLAIRGSESERASFVAPPVIAPKTIHIVLTVTDDGTPPLSSYRRIVVTVQPG